jgi:hypothetical protein
MAANNAARIVSAPASEANSSSVEDASARAGARRPLRDAAFILYGSLALLFFAAPGAVGNRLDDFTPTPVVRAAQAIVAAVARVADATGAPRLFDAARAAFIDDILKKSTPR